MENWIDDLPICTKSGVGFQSNQKYYRQGGGRREIHEREDRCFNLKIPNTNTCLYAVFDGHEGSSVSHYAAQKIPAELILDRNMAGNRFDTYTPTTRYEYNTKQRRVIKSKIHN